MAGKHAPGALRGFPDPQNARGTRPAGVRPALGRPKADPLAQRGKGVRIHSLISSAASACLTKGGKRRQEEFCRSKKFFLTPFPTFSPSLTWTQPSCSSLHSSVKYYRVIRLLYSDPLMISRCGRSALSYKNVRVPSPFVVVLGRTSHVYVSVTSGVTPASLV